MVGEELFAFKTIDFNNYCLSNDCAYVNVLTNGEYNLIITDEKGNVVEDSVHKKQEQAFYQLLVYLRRVKKY